MADLTPTALAAVLTPATFTLAASDALVEITGYTGSLTALAVV